MTDQELNGQLADCAAGQAAHRARLEKLLPDIQVLEQSIRDTEEARRDTARALQELHGGVVVPLKVFQTHRADLDSHDASLADCRKALATAVAMKKVCQNAIQELQRRERRLCGQIARQECKVLAFPVRRLPDESAGTTTQD